MARKNNGSINSGLVIRLDKDDKIISPRELMHLDVGNPNRGIYLYIFEHNGLYYEFKSRGRGWIAYKITSRGIEDG